MTELFTATGRIEAIEKETPVSRANVSAEQLKLFIERIENLEAEKRGISDDIKGVYQEAKANGYDTVTMRALIRLRRMDSSARAEQQALLETYMAALGLEV